MNASIFRKLVLEDVLVLVAVFILARLVTSVVRWLLVRLSETVPPRLRLRVLRVIPVVKLFIAIGAATAVVPILVEPTFRNIVTLLTSVGFALAYTLKDYGLSLAAGLAAGLENTYQPGDWIEVDGAYGEVQSIGARATRIVTADDTEVIIPNARLWSASVHNATSGNRSLLCVANFYLHPDHDAVAARKCLEEIAQTSAYLKAESSVTVIVLEKPWGTHYRLKAYAKESRDQFLFITDLTIRGKKALLSLGMRFAQATFAEPQPI